jgi:hypothetical protein
MVKLNDKDTVSASGIVIPSRRVVALGGTGTSQHDIRYRNLAVGLEK